MSKPEKLMRGLWVFPIVLPDNALECLNCYVIVGENGGRNLLMDTGFHQEQCRADLFAGIEALGLRPEQTDVFISHLHPDHAGNAADLQAMGFNIIMGALDYEILCKAGVSGTSPQQLMTEGIPANVAERTVDYSEDPYRVPEFTAELVNEGDVLSYNGYNLKVLITPGHTPGHICLYDEEKKIMFTGDHILFGMNPFVTAWGIQDDPLGTYIESLRGLYGLDVQHVLPAHKGKQDVEFRERINQLIRHREKKTGDVLRALREIPGSSAFQIACHLSWVCPDKLDITPREVVFFMISEARASLIYMNRKGRVIIKEEPGKPTLYYPAEE